MNKRNLPAADQHILKPSSLANQNFNMSFHPTGNILFNINITRKMEIFWHVLSKLCSTPDIETFTLVQFHDFFRKRDSFCGKRPHKTKVINYILRTFLNLFTLRMTCYCYIIRPCSVTCAERGLGVSSLLRILFSMLYYLSVKHKRWNPKILSFNHPIQRNAGKPGSLFEYWNIYAINLHLGRLLQANRDPRSKLS